MVIAEPEAEGKEAEIGEVNHYYPFGMRMGFASSKKLADQKYLYNGKELQEETGFLAFGWRQLDQSLGRWMCIDPLAEKYYAHSPYNYVGNNPIIRIDPDGRIWDTVIDLAFVVYDVVEIAYDYINTGEVSPVSTAALTADIACTFVPFATGGGLAVRAGNKIGQEVVEHAVKEVVEETTEKAVKESTEIVIDNADKIDRKLLNPPKTKGNAPTFKSDGTSVEIHHKGQNAKGPYKEMHKKDHRLGKNYKKNHPKGQKPLTKKERKAFDKERKKYWKKEYNTQ